MQPADERVIFHFSASQGGIETWISDFLDFGGGTYSVLSTSPTLAQNITLDSRRRPESLHHGFLFLATFRRRFRDRHQRSHTLFLVFNVQSAITLLFLLPRVRFIYVSCNNFENQIPLMSPVRRAVFPRVEKYLLERSEFVFSMSRPDSQRIARMRPDVETIHSIFNDRMFNQGSSSRKDFRGILWIGRLVDLKDPHLAISAFEASANSHLETLTIIGEGPLEPKIRERIAASRYKNRMLLSPRLEAEELASQIGAARLVVITSRTEAAPRTVIECLACGTPVVSTAESDPENWIARTGGGSVSEDRTVESLASLIRENVVSRPTINLEPLASAKASTVMPKLEERISLILDSMDTRRNQSASDKNDP